MHQLNKINVEKAVKYIVSCKNLDGGFGCTPGGESHAGQSKLQVYCNMSLLSFDFGFIPCVIYFYCQRVKFSPVKNNNDVLSPSLQFSVVWELLLLQGLCIISTKTFSGGGCVSGKSNLEVLMGAQRHFQMYVEFLFKKKLLCLFFIRYI